MTDETPRLTGLTIKNYKCLENIDLQNLPPVVCLIGKNGSGKTTVLESFELAKAIAAKNVENKYKSEDDFIDSFSKKNTVKEIYIQSTFKKNILIQSISKGVNNGEYLVQFEKRHKSEYEIEIEELVIFGDNSYGAFSSSLSSNKKLNDIIKIMLSKTDTIYYHEFFKLEKEEHNKNYNLILNSSQSKIAPLILRQESSFENTSYLSSTGDNLPSVAYYFQQNYPEIWAEIVQTIVKQVKGVESLSIEKGISLVTLLFKNKSFEPFLLPKEMSDGTLLMLAHLLLLRHPKPHPILCIDEPEHHLYPSFLSYLAEEIKEYAHQAGNVFLSTHSPDLVNALPFESIYYCKKNDSNVTEIHRLADNEFLSKLHKDEGYLAGEMLRDGLIDLKIK